MSIENICAVTKTDLDTKTLFEFLKKNYGLCVSHESTIFPGLIFRLGDKKQTLSIFESGKMVLCGSKTMAQIDDFLCDFNACIEPLIS